MKNYIKFLIFLSSLSTFSQNEKEAVNLLFNINKKEKCKINVEQTYKNKKGINFVDRYRKEYLKNTIIFNICGEKFIFNPKKQNTDTCSIKNLKKMNIKSLDYVKKKYINGKEFKHHSFKQINIIEKISDTQAVKYLNVYWCCEWVSED